MFGCQRLVVLKGCNYCLNFAWTGGFMVTLFGVFNLELSPKFGFLVPLEFEEGPGQALSVGKVWEGFGFASDVKS